LPACQKVFGSKLYQLLPLPSILTTCWHCCTVTPHHFSMD
jgi:hypothetical protein